MKQSHLIVLFWATIVGCTIDRRVGHSELVTLNPNDAEDIFGPRLGFEFLTKDSALHHSLAIISLKTDSIQFVLVRQTSSNLLKYSGVAIKDTSVKDTWNHFLSEGPNHALNIKFSTDRHEAEVIYFDNGQREIGRVTPKEITHRYENAP